ncbi:MAG: hypothetical protein WD063_07335, partial [Pirellulales bacterium]
MHRRRRKVCGRFGFERPGFTPSQRHDTNALAHGRRKPPRKGPLSRDYSWANTNPKRKRGPSIELPSLALFDVALFQVIFMLL